MGISLALHILSIILWVGGMFFAHMILRPAAVSELEPPLRLKLWRHVFNRFFPWVWVAIVVAPLTGILLLAPLGGFSNAPLYVHIMTTIGSLMVVIFLYVYFAPFSGLKKYLDEQDIPAAAGQLNKIRALVGTNILLGIITVLVATVGKYYLI
ncbi:MAG: hypothetical protein HOM14_11015 [Gammaproteobacteria bacterium]|jgi:uncharacterized membrane protein|nr:hypothetical protein [Gammaproteobacteria bacterium]MBT3723643.1 hypothetical protein [Gammaproteobacteria bacterium]MBT4194104.1 hypothetical protein [Gammaproteobacteria bacterium]MBT4451416.1 hypothetical protein [Gammaproteobacteria bacterium]MBT4860010.1 hypothetical protein [Gammaproteobacteria bacterium]